MLHSFWTFNQKKFFLRTNTKICFGGRTNGMMVESKQFRLKNCSIVKTIQSFLYITLNIDYQGIYSKDPFPKCILIFKT